MSFDEIYLSIAGNMLENIQSKDWITSHIDVEYYGEDALEMGGGFTTKDNLFTSFKFRKFDRRIINDFHRLHQMTIENNFSKWNRAKFTLEPTGKFNMEFEWDQALFDEVERLNNE
ncbi:hypothetical protein A3K86_19055 [Photobacterium jeanii]|uniref:DUF600 family protein n=1 Tax=Photobacterium jeanii TaxID=858640 RepID=A0A178K2X2_9GAMM|nr:immunity protein YezG family protein [Photobacterium jeanii]OAN11073.1 hypothetical protein A3K86_19055 [Photobacterium jeanii]PST90587.1 DUF600 domain-containing protein [Photobacterium jeanii]